jgi:hypothetical protein
MANTCSTARDIDGANTCSGLPDLEEAPKPLAILIHSLVHSLCITLWTADNAVGRVTPRC